MTDDLIHGPLGTDTEHLCVDMQILFAERTDWHLPWLERVLPGIVRLAQARAEATVFTRFVPPENPDDLPGTWKRYYERWRGMTRPALEPGMIELVPGLAALVPPASVVDKSRYSAFAEPQVHDLLQQRGVGTLVITGAETDVCVLATVLGAVDLGYRVVLARNAVCSVSDETHDALLTLYRNRFGQQIEVADIDTILDAWT